MRRGSIALVAFVSLLVGGALVGYSRNVWNDRPGAGTTSRRACTRQRLPTHHRSIGHPASRLTRVRKH